MDIACFTHNDLDGVVSALVVKWFYPNDNIQFISLATNHLRDNIIKWQLHNNFYDFEQVIFIDLDLTNCRDIVDVDNVLVIDHHLTHVNNIDYQFAEYIVKEYTSAAKLAFKHFSQLFDITLTPEQKLLILLADDYDSYKREIELSSQLNLIFWNTQNNFETFLNIYSNGFHDFSNQQQAILKLAIQERTRVFNQLEIYGIDSIPIQSHKCKIISTFATKFINDVADILFERYDADIVIVVNNNSNHVSIRRSNKCLVDCGKLAQMLCDGGGHRYAAGGVITEKFITFTKLLKKYEL